MVLGYWYNDLGGSDRSGIERNFLNATGYIAFNIGALRIAMANTDVSLSKQALQWFRLIWLAIFSTMHAQEIQDQVGDALRDRKTVPLVIGDANARWSLAVMVPYLSLVLPTFWNLGIVGIAAPMLLGFTVAVRFLTMRTLEADKIFF